MKPRTETTFSAAPIIHNRNRTCSTHSKTISTTPPPPPPPSPFLGDLLIIGLSKWLHNELAIFSDFPPIYNSLIFHQTRIGWKQLFVGRFVFEWSDLQQDYLVPQSIISKKYLGTSWITGVIQIIWNHVYHNCEDRNEDLHGVDVAT